MTFGIDQQRDKSDRIILAFLWLHVAAVALMCLALGKNLLMLTGPAFAAAALPTGMILASTTRTTGRIAAAAALMIQISLAVAALDGHPWQADSHMYYFAMLAVLVSYIDWRVILAATAAVAVHHIGLNFIHAAALYPGGADFGRVVMHAVILVIEAASLIAISYMIGKLLASLNETVNRAQLAETVSRQTHEESKRLISVLSEALGRLARKDLAYRISGNLPQAFKDIGDDFNTAAAQLQSVVHTVAESSGTISSGAGEISAASTDLSRRTESQAANLEETAAALEEITRAVKETAAEARGARDAVELAQSEADSGSAVVTRAVDAIRRIERVSSQITQIITVIEEISFQTNLLALNAGVEAARAGETGRGFAVVASEVRALAQRSSLAAQNIKELITTSTTEVSQGVSLVEATGTALDKIVARVGEVSDRIRQIAAVAETQASSLIEVSSAVTQIDQSTQQNAAMVEQATAATENLNRQSEMLNALIQEFSLGAQAGGQKVRSAA